jgi:putative transposase
MNYSASTVLTQTLCWRQDFRMDRVNTSNAAAGYPKANGVYNGSEFTPRDIDPWAYQRCVILDFSRPGKPTENAFIGAFNSKLRSECLNAHWFLNLQDACKKLEA